MPARITKLRPVEVSHVDRGANRRPYFLIKAESGDQFEASLDELRSLISSGKIEKQLVDGLPDNIVAALGIKKQEPEGNNMPNTLPLSHLVEGGKIQPDKAAEHLRPLAKQAAGFDLEIDDAGNVNVDGLDESQVAILQALSVVEEPNEPADPENVDELKKQYEDTIARLQKTEEQLEKERQIRIRKETIEEMGSKFGGLGHTEDLADVMIAVRKSCEKEVVEKLESILSGASEHLKKSSLLREFGSSNGAPSDAEAKLEAEVKRLREADPNLTKEQALRKAVETNPDLYVEYRRSKAAS